MNANGVMSLNANVLGVTFALNCVTFALYCVTTRIVVTIPTICGMLLILIDFPHCTVQCDVQCAMCNVQCAMCTVLSNVMIITISGLLLILIVHH